MVETALTALKASLATVRAPDLQGVTAKRVRSQAHSNPREFDISKQTKLNAGKNLIPDIQTKFQDWTNDCPYVLYFKGLVRQFDLKTFQVQL